MTVAPPGIVLLHGVGLDRTMWGPLMRELDRPAQALDLPGHGAQPPLRAPQTLESLAQDVESRLPEGPVHLVGFSLGALIAQHIARFAPGRVSTLTSVSSVCRRNTAEAAAVESRLDTAGEAFDRGVDAAIERWFPSGESSAPQEVVEETRRVLRGNDIESYVHAYTVFARGDREIGPELEGIRQPSLAITGALDPGSTPEMSRRLGEAIPDCRVHVVPGARHMLPVEDPGSLAATLNAFIDESEGELR